MNHKYGPALRVLLSFLLPALALLAGVGAAALLLAGAGSQAQAVRSSAAQTVFPAVSLVKDINPGADSSEPEVLTAVGDTLFFRANDGAYGLEVWKSDGTAAGTIRITDLAAGTLTSDPGGLTDVNGTLFFHASDGRDYVWDNLYKSDGTTAGTILLKEALFPRHLTAVSDTLFFEGDSADYGIELWKSDGTVVGTQVVKDITPGTDRSELDHLIDVDGVLFFSVDNSELWKSDGTLTGTVKLADVGITDGFGVMANVNGVLYFSVDDSELWKSDGTVTGTQMVKDVYSGTVGNPFLGYLAHVSGTLYFAANDGVHGYEPWKSDGTLTGTQMVKDINTLHTCNASGYYIGTGSTACSSGARFLVGVDDTLYFAANDGVYGYELWRSDGTLTGTQLVKDVNTLSTCDPDGWNVGTGSSGCGSFPSGLTSFDHKLVFAASESASDPGSGYEPWVSDGTVTGTYMLKDITPGDVGGLSLYVQFTEVKGRLFFAARDGSNGFELWSLAFHEHGVFLPVVLRNH